MLKKVMDTLLKPTFGNFGLDIKGTGQHEMQLANTTLLSESSIKIKQFQHHFQGIRLEVLSTSSIQYLVSDVIERRLDLFLQQSDDERLSHAAQIQAQARMQAKFQAGI